MISFVDSHAHLAMLKHSPLDEILLRAKEVGISHQISVSTDEESWEKNQKLAETHPNIYFSLGLHPHDAKNDKCLEKITSIYKNLNNPKKCVGIGELGLDFFYNLSDREEQFKALETQFEIAKKLNLPVIIHCRDAFTELYDRIRKIGISPRGGVMHCFTGNKTQAKEALDLGLKISFSGILTFKNTTDLREAAKFIPDDSIMLETDCPFLAPIPFRGKPNEPSYLPHTALVLAQLRGQALEKVAELTSSNTIGLFQLC